MTSEIKELLTNAYTSSVEANNRRWEYLTLSLDERFALMQDMQEYIKWIRGEKL